MRRTVAAASLAVLLALAGCTALPWAGTPAPGGTDAPDAVGSPAATSTPGGTAVPAADSTEQPGATPTAAPDDPTPTATATGSPYPPGYAGDGIREPRRGAWAHVDALSARESFAVVYNGTILTSNGTTATIRTVQAVEADSGQVYVVSNFSGRGTLAQYVENGTLYERRDPPGENNTAYETRGVNYSAEQFAGGRLVYPALAQADYGGAEVVERDDGTFYRYRASRVGNPRPLLGDGVDPEDVANFDAGVVVGADGIVRDISYRATVVRPGPDARLFVRVRVVDVGSTAVDRPAWVDTARNASEG